MKIKHHIVILLSTLMAVTSMQGAITVTFGETQFPTNNIITSYAPSPSDAVGWMREFDPPNEDFIRTVGQSFIIPNDSNYFLTAITMQLYTGALDFSTPSGFTLAFFELSTPGQLLTTGTYITEQSGSLQPTSITATAGSYFTFTLGTPVELNAGGIYAYFLGFDETKNYPNRLFPAVSYLAADPDGTRVSTPNLGTVYNETAVYYIQGVPVPEPSTYMLVVLAAVGALAFRSRNRSNP